MATKVIVEKFSLCTIEEKCKNYKLRNLNTCFRSMPIKHNMQPALYGFYGNHQHWPKFYVFLYLPREIFASVYCLAKYLWLLLIQLFSFIGPLHVFSIFYYLIKLFFLNFLFSLRSVNCPDFQMKKIKNFSICAFHKENCVLAPLENFVYNSKFGLFSIKLRHYWDFMFFF